MLFFSQLIQPRNMPSGQQNDFERPHRPEGNQSGKRFVFADDALAEIPFEGKIIAKQAPNVRIVIVAEPSLLFYDFVRQGLAGPYLTMRMRIAATHHFAAVFKDLDI